MTISSQKFFDKVKKHLLKQGRKSQNIGRMSGSACTYFNEADGTRCAVGGALPMRVIEKIIKAGKNHDGISTILDVPGVSACLPDDVSLVTDLQDCHDTVKPCNWKHKLKEIAKDYNLNYEGATK